MIFGIHIALQRNVLRITVVDSDDRVTLKVEGRLVGAAVHELWSATRHIALQARCFEVDIGGLTFADDEGEQALLRVYKTGARFLGGTPFSEFLCSRLEIPHSSRQKAG